MTRQPPALPQRFPYESLVQFRRDPIAALRRAALECGDVARLPISRHPIKSKGWERMKQMLWEAVTHDAVQTRAGAEEIMRLTLAIVGKTRPGAPVPRRPLQSGNGIAAVSRLIAPQKNADEFFKQAVLIRKASNPEKRHRQDKR